MRTLEKDRGCGVVREEAKLEGRYEIVLETELKKKELNVLFKELADKRKERDGMKIGRVEEGYEHLRIGTT